MSIGTLVSLLIFLGTTVYIYLKRNYSYWKNINVPYIEPEFFYGNFKELNKGRTSFGDLHTKFYNYFKSKGYKFGGVYSMFRPVFIPTDLKLIKHILIKDFGSFVNHGLYINEEIDPLSGHLFNLENQKWKNLRLKLTPAFTPGKMKAMLPTMVKCSDGLLNIFLTHSYSKSPVDIRDVISRFTTDVIGSCVFGIECNSLKNPEAEFRKYGMKIFERNFFGKSKMLLFILFPRWVPQMLSIKQTNPEVEEFFLNAVKNTVEQRETNNWVRNDFMQLLINLKAKKENGDDVMENLETNNNAESLTINEIAAQCFVFFTAGFETSSSTVTFALLELALNQEIQDKLRQEINTVLKKTDITYDSIKEMTYLDKVVKETLRKHSPFPGTPRICNSYYKIPDTDFVLKPGTKVHISFQAIHRDPEYYPDPDKFDPERFSEENISKRPDFSFLPFGDGPRMCIGYRFGLLQTKIAILTVLKHFKVELNKKTKLPIKYVTKGIITAVDGEVWLDIVKI